jgi:hypothetical protein
MLSHRRTSLQGLPLLLRREVRVLWEGRHRRELSTRATGRVGLRTGRRASAHGQATHPEGSIVVIIGLPRDHVIVVIVLKCVYWVAIPPELGFSALEKASGASVLCRAMADAMEGRDNPTGFLA